MYHLLEDLTSKTLSGGSFVVTESENKKNKKTEAQWEKSWPDSISQPVCSCTYSVFLHVIKCYEKSRRKIKKMKKFRNSEPFFCRSPSADSGHGEHSGAEEAAHGPGHLHEDSGLFLHCHLLRSTFQRGNTLWRSCSRLRAACNTSVSITKNKFLVECVFGEMN